jgi:hypothetical protein
MIKSKAIVLRHFGGYDELKPEARKYEFLIGGCGLFFQTHQGIGKAVL